MGTSLRPNFAFARAATRKSQSRAVMRPPAIAWPLTAATVGRGYRKMRRLVSRQARYHSRILAWLPLLNIYCEANEMSDSVTRAGCRCRDDFDVALGFVVPHPEEACSREARWTIMQARRRLTSKGRSSGHADLRRRLRLRARL